MSFDGSKELGIYGLGGGCGNDVMNIQAFI